MKIGNVSNENKYIKWSRWKKELIVHKYRIADGVIARKDQNRTPIDPISLLPDSPGSLSSKSLLIPEI